MTNTISVNGGNLYYEIAGSGPTLVLAHAGFVDGRMWDSQWEDFTRHYRVIRFDMRGFGRSDPAVGPVSRRADLLRLLDGLGVERTHFVGCSMGGEMIIDFALEHPDRVTALVPVSAVPSGFPMQGEPPPLLLEMLDAMQHGDLERGSELQIQLWVDGSFREPGQVDPQVRQRAAEMNKIAVNNGTWAIADMQPANPLNPPAFERLSEIRVPTLLIVGALDHPEILRAADVMASAIQGAKKLIIPNAAHVPNMEQPEEFNAAVLDFLRGVDA
jgi:2-hydroxy-6-oxonona-2,4-dienedioate hydrolase